MMLMEVDTLTTALTGGITSIATDSLSIISAIVPVAMPILGAVVVIRIAIKVFKKVTG